MNSTAPPSESLAVDSRAFTIFPPDRFPGIDAAALRARPFTVRILLENLVRRFDANQVDAQLVRDLAAGRATPADVELPFYPGRVLLQDFTGIPVLVDLAAMRAAAAARGAPPGRIEPIVPVDLVVDHSVQVDSFATPRSPLINLDREYARNGERYDFLHWAQGAYRGLTVVPPGNGIVHQVNLEHLGTVVAQRSTGSTVTAIPDTLVGTDSHTTMINGLGVLGWGVGGIEAEAVLLGEPCLLPRVEVVGVRLTGALPHGATATDLVLTVTRALREKGVVDRFVEFFGPGLDALTVPDRATISNMCPEYGATTALFPVDSATIAYLRGTGRPEENVRLVEAYTRRVGLWRDATDPEPLFDDVLEIDLASIVPTVAGPKNPEESMPLPAVPGAFRAAAGAYRRSHPRPSAPPTDVGIADGSVVIAAITSCTNTSNPSVMVGAGLIAQRAIARGLRVPPYVKTSMAPGSKVVTAYLERAKLLPALEQLGFGVVGYGCTTCIGNSGPLPPEVATAVRTNDAYVAAVLSGNRNFEARIHAQVRANFLASPMLVVAYALAGTVDLDLARDPLGHDASGAPVFLRELWPTATEVRALVESSLDPELFREKYRSITRGDAHWEELTAASGPEYAWTDESTYLRRPPYFELPAPSAEVAGRWISGARALVVLEDRVSTDHISPAGEIEPDGPAAAYLRAHGVSAAQFNTYGARRGNHEVMVRGTFANVRLRNRLVEREGGYTRHVPSGEVLSVYDAAQRYAASGTPLIVLAGASYGQGSSRDWAAKGPRLLGVRAVAAESFERIHRSNLVGMGVLPLQFRPGEGWRPLGLAGTESFDLRIADGGTLGPRSPVELIARSEDGSVRRALTEARIDSAVELEYFRQGGLLPYVLARRLAGAAGSQAGESRSKSTLA